MIKDFRKKKKFKKIIKNGQFIFLDILQLTHTVISNSEKLTHPTVHVQCTDSFFKRTIQIFSQVNFPAVKKLFLCTVSPFKRTADYFYLHFPFPQGRILKWIYRDGVKKQYNGFCQWEL